MNYKSLTIIALLTSIPIWAFWTGRTEDIRLNKLTFTNTMEWEEIFFTPTTQTPKFTPNFKDFIVLPSPPLNSSKETQHEIETLLRYQKERTKAQISEIESQLILQLFYFNGFPLAVYLNPSFYPKTAPLLQSALDDLHIVVLKEKAYFNRVRPHKLEEKITPAIEVPRHPAYPSGHSSQAHFIALFLGELMPTKKAELWTDADNIAKNREIAGVHFPSDSEAGVLLARQFFDLLMKNEEFEKKFNEAKFEWQD